MAWIPEREKRLYLAAGGFYCYVHLENMYTALVRTPLCLTLKFYSEAALMWGENQLPLKCSKITSFQFGSSGFLINLSDKHHRSLCLLISGEGGGLQGCATMPMLFFYHKALCDQWAVHVPACFTSLIIVRCSHLFPFRGKLMIVWPFACTHRLICPGLDLHTVTAFLLYYGCQFWVGKFFKFEDKAWRGWRELRRVQCHAGHIPKHPIFSKEPTYWS